MFDRITPPRNQQGHVLSFHAVHHSICLRAGRAYARQCTTDDDGSHGLHGMVWRAVQNNRFNNLTCMTFSEATPTKYSICQPQTSPLSGGGGVIDERWSG